MSLGVDSTCDPTAFLSRIYFLTGVTINHVATLKDDVGLEEYGAELKVFLATLNVTGTDKMLTFFTSQSIHSLSEWNDLNEEERLEVRCPSPPPSPPRNRRIHAVFDPSTLLLTLNSVTPTEGARPNEEERHCRRRSEKDAESDVTTH
jgi:hypothetical protein